MTRPRQVLPGTFYLITRSTAQQQFLMQPDKEGEAANAFIYCLVEAAIRFEIDLMMMIQQVNHHHTEIFDRHGRVSEFVEHFHKMFAKCQNRRLERGENFWSSDEVNVMELVDREMVMDKLVYTACNPVKDNLVERSLHWPGANGLPFLLENKPLKATRPKHYFRKAGKMPATVELNLVIPPELGNADEVRREIAELVTAFEDAEAAKRLETNRKVLGVHRIMTQSWTDFPNTVRQRGGHRPRSTAHDAESGIAAKMRYRAFYDAYRDARDHWLRKSESPPKFPPGTYWLRRFAGVAVEPMQKRELHPSFQSST